MHRFLNIIICRTRPLSDNFFSKSRARTSISTVYATLLSVLLRRHANALNRPCVSQDDILIFARREQFLRQTRRAVRIDTLLLSFSSCAIHPSICIIELNFFFSSVQMRWVFAIKTVLRITSKYFASIAALLCTRINALPT